jgi:hypothetical protein
MALDFQNVRKADMFTNAHATAFADMLTQLTCSHMLTNAHTRSHTLTQGSARFAIYSCWSADLALNH